MIVERSYGD